MGIDAYANRILAAIDVVREVTASLDANVTDSAPGGSCRPLSSITWRGKATAGFAQRHSR